VQKISGKWFPFLFACPSQHWWYTS
jgi:hypothetical protein